MYRYNLPIIFMCPFLLRRSQLRYTFYIGDGDTKSFNELSSTKPYPGHDLVKGECIGHVQRRVGGRLRKIKLKYEGKNIQMEKALAVLKAGLQIK